MTKLRQNVIIVVPSYCTSKFPGIMRSDRLDFVGKVAGLLNRLQEELVFANEP